MIAGSLEIRKDLELWICDTGASNYLTFSKVGCLVERPRETQSQGISEPVRKAESKINIPSIVCNRFGNELTRVTLKEVSYTGDSNFNLFYSSDYYIAYNYGRILLFYLLIVQMDRTKGLYLWYPARLYLCLILGHVGPQLGIHSALKHLMTLLGTHTMTYHSIFT